VITYRPIRECAACEKVSRPYPQPGDPEMVGIYVYVSARNRPNRRSPRLVSTRRVSVCVDCLNASMQGGQVTECGRKVAAAILGRAKSRYNDLLGVKIA